MHNQPRAKLTPIEVAWIVRTVISFTGITLAFVCLALWPRSVAVPLIIGVMCVGSIIGFSIYSRLRNKLVSRVNSPAERPAATPGSN